MLRYNPFQYGNPALPEHLIGRTNQIHRIVKRIDNRGQSTAIIGPSRSGKTSILQYISDSELQTTLYSHPERLIFSYLHTSELSNECDPAGFWERILKPLQKRLMADDTPVSLSKAYQTCQDKAFKNDELEELIVQLKQANWRLVLLLDGFIGLSYHPVLGDKTGFLWGLRSLISRSGGTLILIITGNIPLSQFNKKIQHFSGTHLLSYFNFMDEVILDALEETEIDKLLCLGDFYFKESDYRFIKNLAGGHPYLLQVAASILWNSYEQSNEEESSKQQHVEQELYLKVKETLNRIWQSWTPSMQDAFTAIALSHLEKLNVVFPKRMIDLERIMSQLYEVKDEVNELERYGFLKEDEGVRGGWGLYPSVFLLFIVNRKLKPEYYQALSHNLREELFTPQNLTNFSFLQKLSI